MLAADFQLVTSYKPRGDQPRAIDELMRGLAAERCNVHASKSGMICQAKPFCRNQREPHGVPGNLTSALPEYSPGSGARVR